MSHFNSERKEYDFFPHKKHQFRRLQDEMYLSLKYKLNTSDVIFIKIGTN